MIYATSDEALEGAIYSLRAASDRSELPSWLRRRLEEEANRIAVFIKPTGDPKL